MFFHIYRYRLKALFHQKEEFFWNLIFPLILGTCFFAAFGKITERTEGFSTIPVAVVLEQTQDDDYFKFLTSSNSHTISSEGFGVASETIMFITRAMINAGKSS